MLTWRERAAGNYMRVVAQGRGRVVGVDDMIVVTAERLANVHRAARVRELKREFVAGPPRAAWPILAALGGVAVPAVIYVLVNLNVADGALGGWAIPAATYIAFALAVLAIISTHLPAGFARSCSPSPWSMTWWRWPHVQLSLRRSSP